MDASKLSSTDAVAVPPNCCEELQVDQKELDNFRAVKADRIYAEQVIENDKEITPEIIESNELKLKQRIAQCKSVIQSLKSELNEEKAKLEIEVKMKQSKLDASKVPSSYFGYGHVIPTDIQLDDFPYSSCMYSTTVDDKLSCDENLVEYEKQLQKYQNTLNIAQNEKKNAIRKQMLAKAYKLKLLEVENQCNIELLRVKQSLQCLEPLKMIASKWKTNTDDIYDVNNFEFISRYPELIANSGSDVNSYKEEFENTISEKPNKGNKDDTVSYE
ncbi:hypothetical protein K1T71_005511 [Dendrolimus kikuchii]|uniref:Uncharacterized protein n=1 Tax=Dendrolimus kikuchii TaxID=765133 RepID=A0ACC1D4G2_9NEOP|nr:hypothetical protein K1T71_005511 [Dendrolimus kikuchii]